jgi:hypothetical protein
MQHQHPTLYYLTSSLRCGGADQPPSHHVHGRAGVGCVQPYMESRVFSARMWTPDRVRHVHTLYSLTSIAASRCRSAGQREAKELHQVHERQACCMVNATGLDARAAAIVMRVVRNIVNTGRTIACTIHQPAIDIFEVL